MEVRGEGEGGLGVSWRPSIVKVSSNCMASTLPSAIEPTGHLILGEYLVKTEFTLNSTMLS